MMMRNLPILMVVVIVTIACNESTDSTTTDMAPPDNTTVTGSAAKETAEIADCMIKPPKHPLACTMEYDPVCGCDGKTYGNACAARGAGVPSTTPGECQTPPVD